MSEETRRCTKCRKMQPLSEFYENGQREGQRKAWCRTCLTENVREQRSKDREGYLAKSRAYSQKRKAQLERGIELERLVRAYFQAEEAYQKNRNSHWFTREKEQISQGDELWGKMLDLRKQIRALLAQPVGMEQ